jgi:hypothetical protein
MVELKLDRYINASFDRVWNASNFKTATGPYRVVMLNEGDPKTTVGSIRRLFNGPLRVQEQCSSIDPPFSMTYTLLKGAPVKSDYLGMITLSQEEEGTGLSWVIQFTPLIKGTGFLVKGLLKGMITKVIDQIEEDAMKQV